MFALAGRVLIVNQVFLSTLWHTPSCWIWDKTRLAGIKRDITQLLWNNKTKGNVMIKVAWSTISGIKKDGGLGLIDSEI